MALAHRFDRSIGYFWSATHQQIYRTLRAMDVDGWVSATLVAQRGRPDKKVYTVRTQVCALRAERAALLDSYRGFEKQQFPDPTGLHGSALHHYLVLRGGIRAEESTIDWLDEVASALQGSA